MENSLITKIYFNMLTTISANLAVLNDKQALSQTIIFQYVMAIWDILIKLFGKTWQ